MNYLNDISEGRPWSSPIQEKAQAEDALRYVFEALQNTRKRCIGALAQGLQALPRAV